MKLLFCINFMIKKPKICNINFWIESDLPPLWQFSENSSDFVAEPFLKMRQCEKSKKNIEISKKEVER